MRILHTYKETYTDGPGIRYSIYVAGCDLACFECHNPQSWSFEQGELLKQSVLERIKNEIKSNPMLTGITLSGGDPLDPKNAIGTLFLLQGLEELGKHIMVYTGRTAEHLIHNPKTASQHECLKYIDILVDGPFILNRRDTTTFKGSTNQRFIKTKKMYQDGCLRADKIHEYVIDNL